MLHATKGRGTTEGRIFKGNEGEWAVCQTMSSSQQLPIVYVRFSNDDDDDDDDNNNSKYANLYLQISLPKETMPCVETNTSFFPMK